jgi:hypothetical protein
LYGMSPWPSYEPVPTSLAKAKSARKTPGHGDRRSRGIVASHGGGRRLPRQQRGSNPAGQAHTSHHEANSPVLRDRPVMRGLVVGAVVGIPGWHASGQGLSALPCPAGPSGPWPRRTGAPQASATGQSWTSCRTVYNDSRTCGRSSRAALTGLRHGAS